MALYDGVVISNLISGSNSHVVDGFLIASTYTGDIFTPIRDTVRLNKALTGDRAVLMCKGVSIGTELASDRSKSNKQGSYGIQLLRKTKVKTMRPGMVVLPGSKMVTKAAIAKSTRIMPVGLQGMRLFRVGVGSLLHTFMVDSNAANKFKVVVNATHQYKEQTITVTVIAETTQNLVGKWSFSIGSTVVILPSASGPLNSITFSIDPTKLSVGRNQCSLNFAYQNNTTEFIPLVITKEPVKRTSVERTFKSYDGGYSVNNVDFIALYGGMAVVANSSTCGTISTTHNTAVDLAKYSGIRNICADCSGAFFLVSFDGLGGPWWTFNGSSFIMADPKEISAVGMTGAQLNTITQDQWAAIFKQTKLNIMCYLDNVKANAVISSYPEIDYIHGSILYNVGTHTYSDGSVINSGNTFSITRPAGYMITRIAGTSFTDYETAWSTIRINSNTHSSFPINYGKRIVPFDYIVPSDEIITNINVSATYVNSYGGGAESVSYAVYIKPTVAYLKSINIALPPNLAPEIAGVTLTPSALHSGNAVLTANIVDLEDDDIQYRVVVNKNEIIPWTDFAPGPARIETEISAESCPVGTNAVTIEAYDGDKYSTYKTFITRTNELPTIIGMLSGKILSAVIDDADGDKIKYRILLNGAVKQDWTSYISPPISLNYVLDKTDVNIDKQNRLTIEACDKLGETTIVDFDFVGQYYGLLFKDEKGAFSDESGNILRVMDLGIIQAGSNCSPQRIFLSNTTGEPVQNISVLAENMPDDPTTEYLETIVELDTVQDFLNPVQVLPVKRLENNSETTLWVRVKTHRKCKTGGFFNLRAKSESEVL